MADYVRLTKVEWTSSPLVAFPAMEASIAARFGPPTARDLDTNGIGLFDCHLLRFPCGLEVSLWRLHLNLQGREIDPAAEPSVFEVYSNTSEIEHALFHLGIPLADAWHSLRPDGTPILPPAPPAFVVMRADDNGNRVEVTRLTSRCEAESIAATYESRGHKQTYWVEEDPAMIPVQG